jgi:hypothetical protein
MFWRYKAAVLRPRQENHDWEDLIDAQELHELKHCIVDLFFVLRSLARRTVIVSMEEIVLPPFLHASHPTPKRKFPGMSCVPDERSIRIFGDLDPDGLSIAVGAREVVKIDIENHGARCGKGM